MSVSGSTIVATDTSAGLVVGAPVAGTDIKITCGDHICSTNTNPSETQITCPSDCDKTAPANITLLAVASSDPVTRTIRYSWKDPGASDLVGIKIIRTINTPATGPNMMGADYTYDVPKGAQSVSTGQLVANTLYYFTFYSYDTGHTNYSSGVTKSARMANCTVNGRSYSCDELPPL